MKLTHRGNWVIPGSFLLNHIQWHLLSGGDETSVFLLERNVRPCLQCPGHEATLVYSGSVGDDHNPPPQRLALPGKCVRPKNWSGCTSSPRVVTSEATSGTSSALVRLRWHSSIFFPLGWNCFHWRADRGGRRKHILEIVWNKFPTSSSLFSSSWVLQKEINI